MTTAPRPNQGINAYRWLKQDILHGVHAPGEKLRMTRLKARYNLSTGPLREALSQLVAERLVVSVSQRGYRVAGMSRSELHDIYDARAHIEALVVELAVQRGDDTWEAGILGAAHTLSKVADISGPEDVLEVWDRRHQLFHSAIASGCGSTHLMQARARLFDQAERYRYLWLGETVFSEAALSRKREEHARLVALVLGRDGKAAADYVREHLLTPVPIITEVLEKRGLTQ